MSYQLQQNFDVEKKLNYIQLYNNTSSAKIVLNQGASLQELTLNSVPIIQDLHPLKYQDTFASAILFPFANRIENGKYVFKNVAYQTEINEIERNNALHGFVYNKEFQMVKHQLETEKATILLEYNETELIKGFPFTYKIQLEYILQNDSLALNVAVLNTSNKAFPFTIGWHPYFASSDLHNSILKIDSDTKVLLDEGLITLNTEIFDSNSEIKIENKKLDDCYFLNSNNIEFATPNYKLIIHSNADSSFLQVYVPSKENVIALEPTTGISNSFNNKIGLKTLLPNKKYQISWKLAITNLL